MNAALTIEDAQRELRHAFVGGGPGMIISGLFWLAAGVVATTSGIAPAFVMLFLSGMFIFPLATLACRYIFKRRSLARANSVARVVLESTIAMISGLVIAWMVLPLRPDWTFPVAAIAVGTHFFAFRSAYGDATYWLIGALLTTLGALELFEVTRLGAMLPYMFGAIEVAFGLWLTRREWDAAP